MKSKTRPTRDILDSAEDWVARLHSPDCTEADRAAYQRWRQGHPDAASSIAQVEHVYALSGKLAQDLRFDMATRSARRAGMPARARRVRFFAWVSTAAILVLVVAGSILWRSFSDTAAQTKHYASVTGEQRTLYLGDGTAVLLDTDSAVTVRYGAHERVVTLDRGRVQFDVASDPRPFRVHAGQSLIRDIGTRFQVLLRNDGNGTVTLLRGSVYVSLPASKAGDMLVPGQQVSFANGQLGPVRGANLAAVRGWTHGELVFLNRTLAELVAEMNRYSVSKLRLASPHLGRLRVSGVFHAGDQASLVQALRRGWGVRARQVSPRMTVLEAPRTH